MTFYHISNEIDAIMQEAKSYEENGNSLYFSIHASLARRLRRYFNLSPKQMAEYLNLSLTELVKIEHGYSEMSAHLWPILFGDSKLVAMKCFDDLLAAETEFQEQSAWNFDKLMEDNKKYLLQEGINPETVLNRFKHRNNG